MANALFFLRYWRFSLIIFSMLLIRHQRVHFFLSVLTISERIRKFFLQCVEFKIRDDEVN